MVDGAMRFTSLHPVDLSRGETIAALSGEHRNHGGRTEIMYRGVWRRLYRTDLKDDVGTIPPNDSIELYRHKAATCYGARLGDGEFGVVDAYSDG